MKYYFAAAQGRHHETDNLFPLHLADKKEAVATEVVEIESRSFSHAGKVRLDNQDAIRLCDPNDEFTAATGHLYGIADGMGGYAHGGVASTLALDTFFETFYAANGVSPLQKMRVSMQNANLSVYQTAQRMGAGRMGTTLTVVNLIGQKIYVGHIGDSRAYLVRGNKATCLTNDHTRVAELVRMKMLAPEKLRTHNQRSILEKCLGTNLFAQPDIFQVPVQKDDTIIICTDGVWSVIEDAEFAGLSESARNAEELNQRIFELAMERDSDDNISVVVLRFHRLSVHGTDENASRFRPFSSILHRFLK